jgi:hypothetical protein
MLGSTSEFWYIRARCSDCGWFRQIGRCGTNGVTRSVVCLKKAKSPSNLVDAAVVELPADIPLERIEEKFPGFCDPSVAWKCDGAENGEAAKRECRKLIEPLPCPRCKRAGHTVIEIWQYWRGGILSVDCRPGPSVQNQ